MKCNLNSYGLLIAVALSVGGTLAAPNLDELAKLTVPQERKSTDGKVFRYRWAAPEKTEPGKVYPLVVLMHGAGERGTNNISQLYWGACELLGYMRKNKIDGYFFAGQVPNGQQWVDTPWVNTSHRMSEKPSEPMSQQFACLDEIVSKYPIDRSRIYVTGLSMGGYGTWDAIQRRPDFFAAALPCCGGGDSHLAWKIRQVPIWAWHGDVDTAVPVCRSRDMVAALWAVDGNIRYTEIPGCGHGVWGPAYRSQEALQWLFSQKAFVLRKRIDGPLGDDLELDVALPPDDVEDAAQGERTEELEVRVRPVRDQDVAVLEVRRRRLGADRIAAVTGPRFPTVAGFAYSNQQKKDFGAAIGVRKDCAGSENSRASA